MRQKKRSICVFLFYMVIAYMPVMAQGYPVIDVANLMQTINTLYATYDEITQAIQTVQNTYQQLQKQIDMVKSMDWSNIGETFKDMDPTSLEGLLNMHDQITDVTRMVNANMNLLNDVTDTLTKKTVSFGGKKYTFGGLFGFGRGSSETTIFDLPKNIVDYVNETGDEALAGWEGKLTYKQKEAIMRKSGLSPRNYAKIRMVEEQANSLITDLLTTGTDENIVAVLNRTAENQKTIQSLTEAAGDSMTAQQQATTTALLEVATGMARLEAGLARASGFLANQAVAEDVQAEMKQQEREIKMMQLENEVSKWLDTPAGM